MIEMSSAMLDTCSTRSGCGPPVLARAGARRFGLEQAQLAVAGRPGPLRRSQAEQVPADRGEDRRPPVASSAPCLVRRAAQVSSSVPRALVIPTNSRRGLLCGVLSRDRPRAGEPEWQQAALAAGQEHHVELQALGGVQGQQGDRLGPRIQRVALRAQRDLGPEPLDVGAAPPRERRRQLARRADVDRPSRRAGPSSRPAPARSPSAATGHPAPPPGLRAGASRAGCPAPRRGGRAGRAHRFW